MIGVQKSVIFLYALLDEEDKERERATEMEKSTDMEAAMVSIDQ